MAEEIASINICTTSKAPRPARRTPIIDKMSDLLAVIQQAVVERIPEGERESVQALIVEELRRLHEGVLARYRLRPSEFTDWKTKHGH